MAPITQLSSPSDYSSFILKYDTFLLDCDGVVLAVTSLIFVGVIWNGNRLLPGIQEVISYLRSQNKKLIFVTNTSAKSRRQIAQKFANLGIPVEENEVFGCAYSAAVYLSRVVRFPQDKKVYLLGEAGTEEELEAEGISYLGGTHYDDRKHFENTDIDEITPDETIGAVLCATDFHITYKKFVKALTYLRQSPEVLFLATNMEYTYSDSGHVMPGSAAISTIPLQYASGRAAILCGKPDRNMMESVLANYKIDRERTCMVGDRLNTDIKFGIQERLGGTLLVLTGTSSLQDCESENIFPMYVIKNLGDLVDVQGK